jgi:hypothetical protein
MSPVETSGEWRDERLYVLKTLEAVQLEQRRKAESDALLIQGQMVKASQDIKAAHDKIRILESSGSVLKIKNWIMTALLSVIVMLAFELVKGYVRHK